MLREALVTQIYLFFLNENEMNSSSLSVSVSSTLAKRCIDSLIASLRIDLSSTLVVNVTSTSTCTVTSTTKLIILENSSKVFNSFLSFQHLGDFHFNSG